MSPEIKDNTINATTGAVERYFVKLFIFFYLYYIKFILI
nr:photosystem I subunit IX [Poropsis sp. ID1_4]